MKKSLLLACIFTCSLSFGAYAQDVLAPAEPRWATIVLDSLSESDEASFKQRATLQINMFGTASTDILGQNIEVLEKKLFIGEIQRKYGQPDKIETASRDEKGIKTQVQRYTYGQFILETIVGNDNVTWLYAPCRYWADGIRKVARQTIEQTNLKNPE
jgi:hypothetical protein